MINKSKECAFGLLNRTDDITGIGPDTTINRNTVNGNAYQGSENYQVCYNLVQAGLERLPYFIKNALLFDI